MLSPVLNHLRTKQTLAPAKVFVVVGPRKPGNNMRKVFAEKLQRKKQKPSQPWTHARAMLPQGDNPKYRLHFLCK
jgi:hypothetical protein